MLLETGNKDVRFKPRLVEGVSQKSVTPERLILDGQQRLTALFLALLSQGPVQTTDDRGNDILRWYYIKMDRSLDEAADREEEVIFSIQGNKVTKDRDYSLRENEFKDLVFPFHRMFDSAEWRQAFNRFWESDLTKIRLFDNFENEIISRFKQYQVPVILLKKENPKEAVCQVFEKVNTGGVPLTVFELLTASFAADDFNLREDWDARAKRLAEKLMLEQVGSDSFLQTIALLATRKRRQDVLRVDADEEKAPGISCKRRDVLRLTLENYCDWADSATEGYLAAERLLHSQYLFAARDVPYSTQLVPLSAILSIKRELSAVQREKLLRWFWCGVFGELYGSAVESRFARDLPEVLSWLDGGAEPATVAVANFASSRLLTLRTRNSAAYKGLYALMMREGAKDFRTGEAISDATYADEAIDVHHIFPQAWCGKNSIEWSRCDSIVNKTPLSARTNRIIGGNAPSEYLSKLESDSGIAPALLDTILRSHAIVPEQIRSDDFGGFFRSREEAVISWIEKAMGKAVTREADVAVATAPA